MRKFFRSSKWAIILMGLLIASYVLSNTTLTPIHVGLFNIVISTNLQSVYNQVSDLLLGFMLGMLYLKARNAEKNGIAEEE